MSLCWLLPFYTKKPAHTDYYNESLADRCVWTNIYYKDLGGYTVKYKNSKVNIWGSSVSLISASPLFSFISLPATFTGFDLSFILCLSLSIPLLLRWVMIPPQGVLRGEGEEYNGGASLAKWRSILSTSIQCSPMGTTGLDQRNRFLKRVYKMYPQQTLHNRAIWIWQTETESYCCL